MDKRVILLIIALFVAAIGVFSVTEQEGVTHPFAEIYRIDAGSRPGTVEVHLIIETRSQDLPLTHYVEHLAWMNAVGDKARDSARHTNAWTSHYALGYWTAGAEKDFLKILETLMRVFEPIELPRKVAEEERNIILREYELRTNGKIAPFAKIATDAFLYEGGIAGQSLLGTPEKIAALNYDEARALHAKTHRPERAVLIVIGDISQASLARHLRQALSTLHWPAEPANRASSYGVESSKRTPPPFILAEPGEKMLRYPSEKTAPYVIWRRVVALETPVPFNLLLFQTKLLRDILDTNLPGGLAGPLRYDAFLARSFDLKITPVNESHVEISFSGAPDEDISLATLTQAFETQLSQIAVDGIPQDTFTQVLKRFERFWPDWDDEKERADWQAQYIVRLAAKLQKPLPPKELKQLHGRLNLKNTNMLLRQLAGEGRTAIAFIGPQETFGKKRLAGDI